MSGKGDRVAIVTVHGTGDTAPEPKGPPEGEHWFLINSKFVRQLREKLSARGIEADVIPHLWSGANSAMKREEASRKLAARVRGLSRKYNGKVHIVGHSHGGNVANDAACMLDWKDGGKRTDIASMTTVGTPFFRTRITGGERFGAWLFMIVVAISILAYYPATTLGRNLGTAWVHEQFFKFVTLPTSPDDNFCSDGSVAREWSLTGVFGSTPEAQQSQGDAAAISAAALRQWTEEEIACVRAASAEARTSIDRLFSGLGIATVIALAIMLPLSFRGIGRIRRAGRRLRETPRIRSIWHRNDEAIAFLSRLEKTPIEPFPAGSLWAGSRNSGIQIAVRTIFYTILAGIALVVTAMVLANGDPLAGEASFESYLLFSSGIVLVAVATVGAPLVFLPVYLLYRLFAALVLELGLRGVFNAAVGGALKAIALGRDGDNRIGEVSNTSHYYGADLVTLGGEVEQRMVANSAEASGRLFDRYRKAVFSVDDAEGNALGEITNDSLTWDSLIHTTYFEQPEVIDSIAEHIVSAHTSPVGAQP